MRHAPVSSIQRRSNSGHVSPLARERQPHRFSDLNPQGFSVLPGNLLRAHRQQVVKWHTVLGGKGREKHRTRWRRRGVKGGRRGRENAKQGRGMLWGTRSGQGAGRTRSAARLQLLRSSPSPGSSRRRQQRERRRGQLPPWRSSRGTATALSGQDDGLAGHGAPAPRTHCGQVPPGYALGDGAGAGPDRGRTARALPRRGGGGKSQRIAYVKATAVECDICHTGQTLSAWTDCCLRRGTRSGLLPSQEAGAQMRRIGPGVLL
jgi:hypothetical protein